MGLIAIAAAMAVMTGMAAGIGMGLATSKATEAISRQPEASGKINGVLIIGLAITESTAIYGFVVALMLIGKIH